MGTFNLQKVRVLTLVFTVLAVATLVGWIAYIALTLPVVYRAANWDLAWTGFDVGMLMVLVVTGLALWKKRQIALPAATVSATFLLIDTWFDVVTSNSREDRIWAIASALFIEIPLCLLLLTFSRLAMKQSIRSVRLQAGLGDSEVSIRKTKLTIFGD